MEGQVGWIGIRPVRKGQVNPVNQVEITVENGLAGDHDTQPHRQVTLISGEALQEVARTLNVESVNPADTRRNIVINGLDFNALDGKQLELGTALVEITGECHPCSRMDENLGEGGRSAMASKGGLTAKVLRSGAVAIGDTARPV